VSTSQPAAERAYLATKDLILSGRLAAGSLVSEGEIAAQLDVSRTPVREAFLRLETEQLLHLIPKRGAIVVPAPATEAVDILDVRLALETAAVHRLAERGDLEDALAPLQELLAQQTEYAQAQQVEAFAEVDEQFHRAIVTASGNAIADGFYASLADRQRRMTIGSVRAHPERLSDLVDEHRALCALILARDVSAFAASLQAHLETTHHLLLSR
jgi:DNA-binding GntR family transcriptional regulator